MEKKGYRCLPNIPRASSVTDLKKNQDVSGSKCWPKSSRRREPAGPGFSTKSDPSRKPQPQRTGTFDKRPKPRGSYYNPTTSRDETTCLNEYEPELGSVFIPGSKKQSLNHLLNFSYAPRDGYQVDRGSSKGGGRLLTTKKHKYNKEQFLQANCQFIVNTLGDYRQYMNNPDTLVDWELIEQVNVQVSETPSCPICLYPPVAAKMTKCGHIYCWSCILHYLALSDKDWRKCPICFDAVKKIDLKSVTMIPYKAFNVDETITFKLMKRPRGCLTTYHADANVSSEDILFSMSDNSRQNCYAKLVLADRDNILSIISREVIELELQMAEDENCPEKCFIEEAVSLLKLRQDRIIHISDTTPETATTDLVSKNLGSLTLIENKNDRGPSNLLHIPKFHYFYQASDGQHIYLHAINARMLEHTYGSLEFGPKTLTGKILEKEGGSMTEDLRNRLRYLQHLPVTCQFEVAEIQLREPIVSKDTLEHFHEQINTRKKRRQRRAREEKRREKRIEADENRKIGKYAMANLHLESHDQFPDFSEANLQFPEFGLENRTRSESECTMPSEGGSSSDLTSASNFSLESATAGPSFATMLATEKKKQPTWPNLKSRTSPSDTPVKLINVTSSRVSAQARNLLRTESDHESEDYEPVPDFNRSFGDALAQALAKNEKEVVEVGTSEVGKKKKKRNKQKVLFATNMACKGN